MSDRPGPFDKLHEETEQYIEDYEVNEGVVNDLVSRAKEIIQNEDNHGAAGYPSDEPPANPQIIMDQISIPSEEVSSLDLSETLIRISHLQYNSIDLIGQLKGHISSAMLMRLDEAYPKHWEIQLGGQPLPYLFYHLTGIDSLYIADCPRGLIGSGMKDMEYVCFEKINASTGSGMLSIGTAVFKDIEETVATAAQMEIGVFLDVSVVGVGVDFGRAILNDVSQVQDIGTIRVKKDESISAYIKKDISTVNSDNIETILYAPSAGIDVPEDAAETVRPLTDEEYQVIEELADGPPPNEQEVADAIAKLNEGLNNDE